MSILQTELNLDMVRAEFPALASGYAFLDNAGGSQVLARVADRVRDYLLTSAVQLGASYSESVAAGERVIAARRSVALLINAAHEDEGVMGSAIRFWNVNLDTLALDLDELQKLLSPRTRWVAMTHASNILGTVNPVAQVAKLAHAAGAKLLVDAVAYAPHRLVDVQASGADAYVFSFYKVFGPHFAVLWGKRDMLLALPSLNHYFIGSEVLPYKLQPGNVNYELSYGCIGISDYLCSMGAAHGATGSRRQLMQAAFDLFERHEDRLAERLLSYLRGKAGVRIVGLPVQTPGERVPTISFMIKGRASESIVHHLDRFNIGIRFGDFYAKRLIEALGLQGEGGVVRVSIAHYNTLEEIDRLIRHLDEAIG